MFKGWFYLLILLLIAGCIPVRRGSSENPPSGDTAPAPIARAEPIQPIYALSLSAVAPKTLIERFDPPGAGSRVVGIISAKARNTNPFGVTLTKVDYEVFMLGKSVFKGNITPDVFVEPSKEVSLSFPFDGVLDRQKELIKAVAQSFTGTPLAYRLEGSMTFTSQSYGFTTEKVTLLFGDILSEKKLELPDLSLNASESHAYTLREGVPVVRTVIDITNPGDVGYFIYAKDITLYINDLKMALQDISPYPIAARNSGSFEVLFYPDLNQLNNHALSILQQALEGKSVTLNIKGQLLLDVLGVDTTEIPNWDIRATINP